MSQTAEGEAYYDVKRKYLLPYREEFIVNTFTDILKTPTHPSLNQQHVQKTQRFVSGV